MAALGVDPGMHGAAAVITLDRRLFVCRFEKHTPWQIFQFLKGCSASVSLALVENVHTRPGDDHKKAARIAQMMRALGLVEGLLACAMHEPEYVEPQVWQREFGLAGIKDYAARKKACHLKAKEIFPNEVITKDQADAILIAEYAWRKEYDKLTQGRDSTKERRTGTGIDWTKVVPKVQQEERYPV